jgi:hypothetical protein
MASLARSLLLLVASSFLLTEAQLYVGNLTITQIYNGTGIPTGQNPDYKYTVLFDATFNIYDAYGNGPLNEAQLYYNYGVAYDVCQARVAERTTVLSRVFNCPSNGLVHSYPGATTYTAQSWIYRAPLKGTVWNTWVTPQMKCLNLTAMLSNCDVMPSGGVWGNGTLTRIAWPPKQSNITNVTYSNITNQTTVTWARGGNTVNVAITLTSGPGSSNGWADANYTIFWSDTVDGWTTANSVNVNALAVGVSTQSATIPRSLVSSPSYWSILPTNLFMDGPRHCYPNCASPQLAPLGLL